MTFDTSKIRASAQRLKPLVKKSRAELMKGAARGFVKDIVAITPPASQGSSGAAAKKAGENAVLGDVLKLAQPVVAVGRGAQKQLVSATELLAAHARSRNGANGRVNPRSRKEKLLVAQQVAVRVITQLQKRVGWLAAGWNKAASHLGVRLPAWVRRHGDSYGEVKAEVTATKFRLELGNVVRFVGNVRDYGRRVQRALDYQANKLDRQADYLMKKAVKAAGF